MKLILSNEERALLNKRSNLRGAWVFLCNYIIMLAALVMVISWTNPVTVLLAVVIVGARQLGLGVLVHECGHGTLFASRQLNKFFGNWLAAAPIFLSMRGYIQGHIKHHRLAGTKEDPDLPNYRDYPISRTRLKRKLWRDVSGQTGWRQIGAIASGIKNLKELPPDQRNTLKRGLLVHLVCGTGLSLAGYAWVYLIWWVAYITAFPLVSRIRQVGEHGAVPDLFDPDPRLHTRTIIANWLERLFICPLGVNYHLEHHLMMSTPIYNLPKLHQILSQQGFYNNSEITRGYLRLFRQVTLE